MQIVIMETMFIFGMYALFSGGFVMGPVLLVMHFLMPKAVLDKYFKPPYFRILEVEMFTGIPYAPMRTIMLTWILAFPKYGKKRGLCEAYTLAPNWYRIFSKVFVIWVLINLVSILGVTVGFGVHYFLIGQE